MFRKGVTVPKDAISLHMSGGPQGSRTPDLRRAKALELVPSSHRESQEVIDSQGIREAAVPGNPDEPQRTPRIWVAEWLQTDRHAPLVRLPANAWGTTY